MNRFLLFIGDLASLIGECCCKFGYRFDRLCCETAAKRNYERGERARRRRFRKLLVVSPPVA